MENQEQVVDSLEPIQVQEQKFVMYALFATTNTAVAHALDVAQKRNVLISKNLF
jgi:hypothetical protein